jgi:hypothetical protein
MKRLHVHVSVRDLEASIRFYAELFASELCRPSEAVLDILKMSQMGAFTKEDGERVVGDGGVRLR